MYQGNGGALWTAGHATCASPCSVRGGGRGRVLVFTRVVVDDIHPLLDQLGHLVGGGAPRVQHLLGHVGHRVVGMVRAHEHGAHAIEQSLGTGPHLHDVDAPTLAALHLACHTVSDVVQLPVSAS